jgi:methionine-rich copper-binding protein CopC
MGSLRSTFGRLQIPATALSLSLGLPATALAHANLVSATPAAKSMAMPPPTELRLKFSEGIEIKFTKVKVTGPDKKAVETGTAKLDPSDNTVLIVPLSGPLPDGKYTVDWQVVSVDGHKTKGSYGFESIK